ncbi:hypothetical protein BZG36_05521 [Bifiguratus adelaidae]|uniref:Carboxylic ester hydrolase n=1 Tax=Bifiguratus adelaidae TaxID=1938954 RepID=A0A261XTT3_9FUNG|nr:hypothetical protein BZG36_05521 [Bifiguratus adelaidae]
MPMTTRTRIQQGVIEGSLENSIHKFFGVPYAAPPTGDRRWREPTPPDSWDAVRETKQFGPACIQTIGASFDMRVQNKSEDCLYLNVWTSTVDATARQPVMVWIHGGGNLGGAGSEDAFDGTQLAVRGVTVVTFNYRLGAFGFLVHPDLGCNFAVLDHVAALSWVANNIESFGGASDNVTIFGESAGALSVCTLLSVSRARGLFHRAIIQSAGFEPCAFAPPRSYEMGKETAEKLFDRLGTKDPIKLRQIPTEEVGKASHELCGVFPPPGEVHTPANIVWNPVPDGDIVALSDFPGWPPQVTILLGRVENEARYFVKPTGSYNRDLVQHIARVMAGKHHSKVMAYFDSKSHNTTWYEALDDPFTTAVWTEPALATLKRFEQLNGRQVFIYIFGRVSPGARKTNELAKHTSEIRFVFGNLAPAEYYDENDAQICRDMQGAWIEFARNGVPRSNELSWPVYSSVKPMCSVIKDDIHSAPLTVSELTGIIHSLRTPEGPKNLDWGACQELDQL